MATTALATPTQTKTPTIKGGSYRSGKITRRLYVEAEIGGQLEIVEERVHLLANVTLAAIDRKFRTSDPGALPYISATVRTDSGAVFNLNAFGNNAKRLLDLKIGNKYSFAGDRMFYDTILVVSKITAEQVLFGSSSPFPGVEPPEEEPAVEENVPNDAL